MDLGFCENRALLSVFSLLCPFCLSQPSALHLPYPSPLPTNLFPTVLLPLPFQIQLQSGPGSAHRDPGPILGDNGIPDIRGVSFCCKFGQNLAKANDI